MGCFDSGYEVFLAVHTCVCVFIVCGNEVIFQYLQVYLARAMDGPHHGCSQLRMVRKVDLYACMGNYTVIHALVF